MNKLCTNNSVVFPNLLLVSGNGRNVGKTWFSCQLIKHLAKSTTVTAIKVSSHLHTYSESEVICKGKEFVIIEEKSITKKDSSLMLQAGAQKVYFIMSTQKYLTEAFSELLPLLPSEYPIVCESGGLHQVLTPDLFFFVNKKGKEIEKGHHLAHQPIVVINDGTHINFKINKIRFQNHRVFVHP